LQHVPFEQPDATELRWFEQHFLLDSDVVVEGFLWVDVEEGGALVPELDGFTLDVVQLK